MYLPAVVATSQNPRCGHTGQAVRQCITRVVAPQLYSPFVAVTLSIFHQIVAGHLQSLPHCIRSTRQIAISARNCDPHHTAQATKRAAIMMLCHILRGKLAILTASGIHPNFQGLLRILVRVLSPLVWYDYFEQESVDGSNLFRPCGGVALRMAMTIL